MTESALVTGAARRVGRILALHLAAQGRAVAVHFERSAADAAAVVAEIRAAGGHAEAVGADLTDPDAAESLVDRATRLVGPLGVLVNNASLFRPDDAAGFSVTQWQAHFGVHVLAPSLLSRRFAALLPADARGAVVNIIDSAVARPGAGFFSYMASKMALAQLTVLLAQELAPRVRVNGIAPGLTLPSGAQSESTFRRLHDQTPLGRGNSPEDVAAALSYLLAAPAVTGQILYVDGGQHVRPQPLDPSLIG